MLAVRNEDEEKRLRKADCLKSLKGGTNGKDGSLARIASHDRKGPHLQNSARAGT